MEGNQQPTEAELEQMTNEEEGWERQPEQGAPTEPTGELPTNETPVTAEPPKVEPETPAQSQSVSITDDILKSLEETPFKSVPDVVKAYKNLQSEFTKERETVKPHKQLIDRINSDVNFRQFLAQAEQLYSNPQLAQSYLQPQQATGEPNPMNYDLYTPEGMAKFQQDTLAYAQKAAFETVNQRMSGWEQQQAIEREKLAFRQKYSDVDPDDVLNFVQERQGKWSLEDAYKIKNYDNLKQQAYEQAKKEIIAKSQEASKNTPANTGQASTPSVSPSEMMQFIQRYGVESANKKWGSGKVRDAIKQFTEENES